MNTTFSILSLVLLQVSQTFAFLSGLGWQNNRSPFPGRKDSSIREICLRSNLKQNEEESAENDFDKRRRALFRVGGGALISAPILAGSTIEVNAISLPFGGSERIQLELCLVSILRVRYWAENVAQSMQEKINKAPPSGMTDLMKGPYLEARLGAKAALTGKIGGGANLRVLNLGKIQLRECLRDTEAWYNDDFSTNMKNASKETKSEMKRKRLFVQNAIEGVTDSLASVVEFDGLETLIDPSPRSSLALSMYSNSKAQFIRRTLMERTIPNCDTIVTSFGRDRANFCRRYVEQKYPDEIPVALRVDDKSIIN